MTERWRRLKSIGIVLLSGFKEMPKPRFSPRVSRISVDTDSLFWQRLWHLRLFDFRGRFIGSLVPTRWFTLAATE